jgi:hypothetical protein
MRRTISARINLGDFNAESFKITPNKKYTNIRDFGA